MDLIFIAIGTGVLLWIPYCMFLAMQMEYQAQKAEKERRKLLPPGHPDKL